MLQPIFQRNKYYALNNLFLKPILKTLSNVYGTIFHHLTFAKIKKSNVPFFKEVKNGPNFLGIFSSF